MIGMFREWRKQRILAKSEFSHTDWQQCADGISVLDHLDDAELARLFELAVLFLHQKTFSGAQGFVITPAVRQSISLQACLPILNLGLEWYAGWSSVIVYPDAFKRESTSIDEFGVAHMGNSHLSGEAWVRGPVILSWNDAKHAGDRDGHNVVIHEFVHKLDMLNGRANGFPPMQKGLNPESWSKLMGDAFGDFQVNPKAGLDRYGATNPAEFFAVLSEVFFETPASLVDAYPELYELMTKFFLQSTLKNK